MLIWYLRHASYLVFHPFTFRTCQSCTLFESPSLSYVPCTDLFALAAYEYTRPYFLNAVPAKYYMALCRRYPDFLRVWII
jgi:hypothetical protein